MTTTRAASSRLRTPAMCAAAISPALWPIMAAGTIPHECQSLASATSIGEDSRLSVFSVRQLRLVFRERIAAQPKTSRRDAWIACSHSSMAARKTGSSRSSDIPISAHCEPWPEHRNTTFGVRCAARPRAIPERALPSMRSSSNRHNSLATGGRQGESFLQMAPSAGGRMANIIERDLASAS